MKIVFDIDGTLTDFEKFVLENSEDYMKRKYGLGIANYNGYDLDEVYALRERFIEEGLFLSDAYWKARKVLNSFWTKYYIKYCFMVYFRIGASDTINKLYNNGDEITIMTSRKHTCSNNILKPLTRFTIKEQLLLNNIKYHSLKFFPSDYHKLQAIKQKKPDVVIDDKPELLLQISDVTNAICINSAYNREHKFPNNVLRADGYENSEVLNHIESVRKGKVLTLNK